MKWRMPWGKLLTLWGIALLLFLIALLAGCGDVLYVEEFKVAEQMCAQHGGVKFIKVDERGQHFSNVVAYCNEAGLVMGRKLDRSEPKR